MKTNPTRLRSILLALAILLAATATSALAMNEELIGAVVKTDQGVALSTNAGEYLILGKNLESLAGKTVAVTGDVEIGALSKTVRVASVRLLEPRDVIDPTPAKGPAPKG